MLFRPFSLKDISVVLGESWWVDFEFSTLELYCILYMEPKKGDVWISFTEAYSKRFFERAYQDSKGKYWLKSSKSVRQKIHLWARERGYFIYFEDFEIEFPKRMSEGTLM